VPILVQHNKTKVIALTVRDDEGDAVDYTINIPVGDGTTVPTYGSITDSGALRAGTATASFTYVAPATVPTPNTFNATVTLNDGPNLVSHDISIRVY